MTNTNYKAYELKIYANKNKEKELNKLISFWRDQVNHKIKIFWNFNETKSLHPPKEYVQGGRLMSDASRKAWQIAKGAKKSGQKIRPAFVSNSIDINEFSGYVIDDLRTKEFDLWLNVISLTKHKRLKLPCKKYEKFNEMLKRGELKKSFKIIKKNGDYYAQFYVGLPKNENITNKVIGLDMGLNKTVMTSDGKVFGEKLKPLRIRTKRRRYKNGLSPFKQGLNHVAKKLVENYPDCNFAVEDLLFKGKGKRSRTFRRNNNNWAYAHLSRQLVAIGDLKGFQVFKTNPAYTSQECPMCSFTAKTNRLSADMFKCGQCGFTEDADRVGALNIAERVVQMHPYLKSINTVYIQKGVD
jgi:IS605 OrfB family transposase